MKISDVMLDMATGDASFNDAYVQECVGKINVSHAFYEAAYKISELDGNGDHLIVQEAADAGLPTDPEGAAGVACEAVKQELSAFYDAIVASAKSVRENLAKSDKLARGVGKMVGVSPDGENVDSFARKVAAEVISRGSKGKYSIDDKKVLKGKFAVKMADAYESGVSKLLSAYGVSIGGESGSVSSLKELSKRVDFGGKLIKFDKITSKDGHYTETVRERDIVDNITSLYKIYAFSKEIIDRAGSKSAKKSAMETLASLWGSDCGGKKITGTIDSINEDIKRWTENLTTIVESIKTGLGDSFYAIMESLSN